MTATESIDNDDVSNRLRHEALEAMEEEPQLTMLLKNTILAPGVVTFEDAVASTITYRLLLKPCNSEGSSTMMFCPNSLRGIIADALQDTTILEAGHTMSEAVRLDAQAVCDRDPAVESLLEVVLFMKGFAALVCHRAAYHKWHASKRKGKKSMVALWLQSQASAVFGLDIHPAATLGAGIMLDHGTGVVIGETATVGDGCTLLHGVTLGGTGKESGDRHPKVGNDVLIGANASLLGNIHIGNGAKIGAGSIVLGPIPSGATAVGAPAKIVGRAKESKPASMMDETLQQVSHLNSTNNKMHKSESSATVSTTATSITILSTDDPLLMNDDSTESDRDDSIREEDDNDRGGGGEASGEVIDTNETAPKEDETSTNQQKKKKKKKPGCNGSGSLAAAAANQSNSCCPYRDYVLLAKSAPAHCITYVTLHSILEPLGCTFDEIGEVFFALDHKNRGYVKPKVFFNQQETEPVICHNTRLSKQQVETVLAEYQKQWQQQWQQQQQVAAKEATKEGDDAVGAKVSTPTPRQVSAACLAKLNPTQLKPTQLCQLVAASERGWSLIDLFITERKDTPEDQLQSKYDG